VRADTQQAGQAGNDDEALNQLVKRIQCSPRLRAAIDIVAMRIDQLDVLEQAGFPITNAVVTVVFDGARVTSGLDGDGLQLRGGGAINLRRSQL
jgi:hypothetical protein